MTGKHPKESQVEMTELVLPQHTNPLGSVFGGTILSWVDIAATISAQRHSGHVMVTASLDAMNFLAPIQLGWIVSISAFVNYAGNTSCEVEISIRAEDPITKTHHHTASAYVTMVALDRQGKPQKIPKLIPQTPEEKKRHDAAIERKRTRLQLKEKIQKHH